MHRMSSKSRLTGDTRSLGLAPDSRLHEKVLFGRQAALLIVTAMAFSLRDRTEHLGAMLLVLALVAIANTIDYWLNSIGRFTPFFQGAQTAVDATAISFLLWATGGAESPLFLLYVAEILAGAVSLSLWSTQLAVVLSVAGYFGAAVLEPRPIPINAVSIHVTMLIGSGWLALRLIRQLRRTLQFRAAATAHEVKNAVHAVRTLIGEARVRQDEPGEAQIGLDAASSELDSLAQLAQRLYEGALSPARRSVPLHRVVEDALILAGPALREARITPLHDLQPGWVWIHADEEALRHCFLNFFLNAANHAPPDSIMRIDCLAGLVHPRLVVETCGERVAPGDPSAGDACGDDASWGLGLQVVRDVLAVNGAVLRVQPLPGNGLRATVIFRGWRMPLMARGRRFGVPDPGHSEVESAAS